MENNISGAEIAAGKIQDGERSLELYDEIKKGLLDEPELIDVIYPYLRRNKELKEELMKTKEIEKIITKEEKAIDKKLAKLAKESPWFMFNSTDKYMDWYDTLPDKLKEDDEFMCFLHSILKPLMYQWIDEILHLTITKRGQEANIAEILTDCDECGKKMKLYGKEPGEDYSGVFNCMTCSYTKPNKKGTRTDTKIKTTVALDFDDFPDHEIIADAIGKPLANVIEKYEQLKDGDKSKYSCAREDSGKGGKGSGGRKKKSK